MPESTGVHNKRDLVLVYSDSGGSNSYTVAREPGDFSLTIPLESENFYLDRGKFGSGAPSLRLVDDQPMTFSHSMYMRDVGDTSGSSYASGMDLFTRYASGYVATTWTGTHTVTDAFTLDLAITVDGTWKGESDKTLTLPYCTIRGDMADGDPSAHNVTGTSYALRPTLS